MQENFLNEPTFSGQKQFFVYAKDLIRRKFALVNNICSITYTSQNWNSTNFKLCIYAKCIYFYNGCKKYKIVYKPLLHQFDVFSNCENITHPELEYKSVRNIPKMTLKDQKAANWRDVYLCKQSKELRQVGQVAVPSAQVIRKIRSEAKNEKARHSDPFIDLYLMLHDKNWSDYIQKISYPLEIYLFSLSQLTLIQKLNPHTLFMDATGNVIKKISLNSKRVFMYSIIAHIQREENKTGILFPLCESFLSRHFSTDIERFLIYVKTFCKDNNLRWPICQRIISDWSMALITAILWVFCNMELPIFVNACFKNLDQKLGKPSFVILQLCTNHIIRILYKDAENHFNESEHKFVKPQMITAMYCSNIERFFQWVTTNMKITTQYATLIS
uniref:MULE transposase domain-containing protein n=1 Tax=Glossina palpalis gambiensis TaxID=67801 RepID=A0A1B0BL33_9MUSC